MFRSGTFQRNTKAKDWVEAIRRDTSSGQPKETAQHVDKPFTSETHDRVVQVLSSTVKQSLDTLGKYGQIAQVAKEKAQKALTRPSLGNESDQAAAPTTPSLK